MTQTLISPSYICQGRKRALSQTTYWPMGLCSSAEEKQQEMAYDAAKSRKWERFIDQRRKILAISLLIARRKTFELLCYVQISR